MTILSKLGISASIADFAAKKLLFDLTGSATVAAAGSASTDATLLASGTNLVTDSDGTKGVILPVGEIEMAVKVVNTVADSSLKVYPASGEQINSLTATTGAFTVPGGNEAVFHCDDGKHWYVAAGGTEAFDIVTVPVIVMTGTTGAQEIRLTANLADALSIEDTAGDFVVFDSTTNAKTVKVDKTVGLNLGAFASTADGSGFPLSTTRTAAVRIYSDDAGVALGDVGSVPDLRGFLSRMLVTEDATANKVRVHAAMGHLKAYAATGDVGIWNNEQAAGVYGYVELVRASGTATYGGNGVTAAVLGCFENSGAVTVNTSHVFAGVAAISKLTSDLVQTGRTCAFYGGIYDTTNWSDGTARAKWGMGLYLPAAAIGGATTSGTAAAIMVGDFASSYATGSGIAFTSTYSGLVKAYGESTSDLTNAVNARVGVFRHLIVTASGTINHETYGLIGQCNVKNSTLAHLHAGLMGTFEVSTAATVNSAYAYGAAGVMSRLGVGTSILTATKAICGFAAVYNGGALASGDSVAFAACSTTATNFTHLLAADHCDNILYAATGTAYENGVKVATQLTGNAYPKMDGVIRIKIASTLYYVPFYAAGNIDNE